MHHRTRAQAANADGHAAAQVGIQPRLGAIGFVHQDQRRLRRGGQLQFLRPALECADRIGQVGQRGLVLEGDRHGHGVAVDHGHAIGVRADRDGVRRAATIAAENLLRLALHLLFFATDERDDVAENVERGHAGIARARYRLHGRDDDGLDAELAQRRQGHGEHHGRAVGVGDDGAGPAFGGALFGQQREVVGIDLGNEQRNQRIHPEVAGVADHDVAGGSKRAFDLAGDGGIEAREHHLGTATRHACIDDAVGRLGRHRRGEAPRRHQLVGLAFGPLTRRQPGQAKPRVPGQPRHELLPDYAGRAKDAHFDLAHH